VGQVGTASLKRSYLNLWYVCTYVCMYFYADSCVINLKYLCNFILVLQRSADSSYCESYNSSKGSIIEVNYYIINLGVFCDGLHYPVSC
jgi:hypothetical protein